MKFFLFIIFVFIVLLSACKKEPENDIRGFVSDYISKAPLADVKVNLEANELTSGSVSANFSSIAYTYTDNSGKYVFNFDSKPVLSYRISFSKEGYLPHQYEFSPTDVSGVYNKDFSLFNKAYIFFYVKNDMPYNSEDRLSFHIADSNLASCSSCCHTNSYNFYGQSVDETILCYGIGGDSIRLVIVTEKRNNVSSREVSLYVPVNDTLFYDIIY